ALYDAVVAPYSSPATAALGRLLLPYLFPELSAFATVEDLVSHLRTSDTRYRAAAPTEDHFLSLDPTVLTIDLLEQHLLAAETSAVAVGVARGTPHTPFFEGMSGLLLLVRSVAAVRPRVAGVVEGAAGVVVGAAVEVVEAVEVVAAVGVVAGVGALVAAVEAAVGVAVVAAVAVVAVGLELSVEILEEASGSGSSVGARPLCPSSFTCGKPHTQHRCFSCLDDAWRAEFGDEVELPHWAELLRSGVAIFDLDYDAILFAMYALSARAEGDYYRCVPPDPGIEAAALGAIEFALPGTTPAEALHTFTLNSGASRCFFRDSCTLTPLSAPVPVRLANPSTGPVVAHSSTVLPCPADSMVTTTTPGGQRVSICTCTRTGHHLATFTRRPGSSLYTLATEPPQVAAFAEVSASGAVAPPCSCLLLLHHTLLWHHRLGHLSLPCLRGMHSRLLVSGLPRSLPPLPPSPAPPCLPNVEGRQRAAPCTSSFSPTIAPLHTLQMDVWAQPASVDRAESATFCCKGEVVDVLIPCIRAVRLELRERFGQDLPFLRLHSGRGGEFSSNLLRDFCPGEGSLQSFTLPASPQKNGIAERRIGLVMEVACTSMMHAAASHFVWPFAVQYAAHQLNLWLRVSLPEISPTLRWTGQVGDASVFRIWGSRAFVSDMSADKLSARAIHCVFLGFLPYAHGWQFYHPTSRRVLPSQDVTFDESVPFYRLFPYSSAPLPPPPLFLAPGPPSVDPLLPEGPAPSGVSQVDPLPGTAPVVVAVGSGAAPGAASGGAEPGGAGSEGAGSGGAEPGGEEPGGAEPEGVEPGGAEPRGAASSGGAGDARAGGAGVTAGASGTGGTAAAGPGGARTRGAGAAGSGGVGGAGAGDPTEPGAAGARGSYAGGAGAGSAGAGGARVGGTSTAGAGAVDPRVGGAGGTVRPRPYFVPLLQQSQPPLQPASPLPAPSPYTEQSGGLAKRREPASRPVSPVRTARRVPRSCPPPVSGTHAMALLPSSVPLCVPLRAPPESSLPDVPDPESDRACGASPIVFRLLATAVTDLYFESAAVSALVAEMLDFATACRLDYATALVVEQEDFECLAAAVPRFASMLLAPEGDPDAPDILTPRSYAEAITGPYSSHWQAAMDAEMAYWKSTSTYVDEVPPPGANIVDGMWIFRVKRLPGSPLAFKAHYVARGFSPRQGFDYFHAFSPTPKMTTLWVLLHVAAQRDYELHSLDFSTAFLQGSLHVEIWLGRPPCFTDSFPAGTQWSLRRPVYGLRQAPREWHDTVRTTLAALGFAPATADPSLFLRTDTSLPPSYILVYIVDLVLQRFGFQFSSPQPTPLSTSHPLSAPPSDESVEPSGLCPELVGCLMYLMTCTRPDLAYRLSLLARYMAPGRHRKVHWDVAKRVLRYLCNTLGMGLVLEGRGLVVQLDDAVVARYSSPANAALSRLMLPYLFPDLAAFAIVAELITHLHSSDARYRAALPSKFCAKNPPPIYITLYYLVTHLPDSLASVWDHFLSLCPTELTVDLLEERLAAAEKSILAVGASRGDRCTPFFEGCSPIPLLPSVASASAINLVVPEEVGAASVRTL
ncbi:unnamed protein product, partial [Closterium sp. NIES-54]